MKEVGIETLRVRLNDYLKLAQEGERILITERGRSAHAEGQEAVNGTSLDLSH